MPVEIKDLDSGNGNIIKFKGDIDRENYVETHRSHLCQPAEKIFKYKYSIVDAKEIGNFSVTTKDILEVSGLCINASLSNKHVIVAYVINGELEAPFVDFFIQISKETGWEFKIFTNKQEALEWVRISVLNRHNIDVYFDD